MAMKKIHIILLSLLMVLGSSCSRSYYISKKNVMDIHSGMTQQEVQTILGKPDYRRFNGGMEEWEFYRDDGTPVVVPSPITIIVQFINKEVISMDTFAGHGRPSQRPVVVPPPPITNVEVYPDGGPLKEVSVMTDSEFDNFIEKLKFTIMDDDQKRMIERMLKEHDVTSAQCLRIVKEIGYTPDKVEIMKKLYPYVRDKQNFNKVIDTLFSPVYKDEMNKFIKEYHQSNK